MRALAFLAATALLGVCTAARNAAAETSSDESLVAERLSSRALAVLDGMFGPGRAKLLVEVRGERLEIKTETEILTPLNKDGSGGVKEALRILDLPGYYKDKPPPPPDKAAPTPIQPFQKDFEHSLRDAGFEIKKIEVTAVLDSALTETEARDAAQLLPQLLRIDTTRGDVLSIVRAPMRPAWKSAFSTPADWRKLTFAAAGLIGALLVVMILSSAFVRGARVFAKELTARHEQPGLGHGDAGEPLPELVPGALGGLVEADGGGGGGASPAALGRRFDFLETADATNAARILATESPADLAQIFAYLAKLAPETASKLFSKLPPAIQADASAAILKMTTADPDRLNDIEERLKDSVANGLQGSQRLATILSRFPGDERAMLLSRLASLDSRSVQEIESQLISFEDFEALSPADLRRIMGAVPYELWGTALRGASQSLISRVLSELPDGPRDLIREQVASPQPKDKVVAARSKLLDTYLELASKGQITLEQGSGAEETL